MLGRTHRRALAALAVGTIATVVPAAVVFAQPSGDPGGHHGSSIAHVLLVSVDGLHQSDVEWYVGNHPSSELAKLVGGGAEYARAQTPIPSDSFPGVTAQVTGGNPRTTGVYYDDEYSHAVLPAGTTSCHGQPTGGEVVYDSPDDRDETALDAGQGLTGLPTSILEMTGQPQTLINPAALPVDPQTCKPIYPHEYLEVNTIFEVAHAHGLRTAWSDKHPAYEALNGPSGNAIDDLFTPEIDSNALEPDGTPYPGEISWTGDNAATMQYDSYKVQAVLNEIDGYDHSHKTKVGVPAIFGMNFQTVSTAEKLLASDGLSGGYLPGTTTPADRADDPRPARAGSERAAGGPDRRHPGASRHRSPLIRAHVTCRAPPARGARRVSRARDPRAARADLPRSWSSPSSSRKEHDTPCPITHTEPRPGLN
jgi:hypothetical protein